MSQPFRFLPARSLTTVGLLAAFLATLIGVLAVKWTILLGVAMLLMFLAAAFALVSFRPAIEVHEMYMTIGPRIIPWTDVRQVITSKWTAPLLLKLVLTNRTTVTVFYPGDFTSCDRLLRSIRQNAKWSLLDGTPWHQYWHQPPQPLPNMRKKAAVTAAVSATHAASSSTPVAPSIPVIRPEDEADVERLYQLLKSVGHLDNSRQSADDK